MREGLRYVRILLGMGLLGASALLGCTPAHHGGGPNFVTGRITPAHFRFQTVTALDRGPSGWRAICLRAQVRNGSNGLTDVCSFEVGLPLRTEDQGLLEKEVPQSRVSACMTTGLTPVTFQAPFPDFLSPP